MPIPLLFSTDPPDAFPDIEDALLEPNGLLAAGGDLGIERLLYAYRHGIFPWFSEGEPILWWSPDPRCILRPDTLHISKSLRKTLKSSPVEIRTDTAFRDVILACASPRPGSTGTWITAGMLDAYCELHAAGYARSIECWLEGELVGGLYGVSIGPVFFGESMFSRVPSASRMALVHLARCGSYALIDCQLPSEHLLTMGAVTLNRRDFREILDTLLYPESH